MCGRFTLATPPEILEALFGVNGLGDWNEPRYNIAPQVRIATVRRLQGRREGQSLLWGAANPRDWLPSPFESRRQCSAWESGLERGRRDSRPLINARSETAAISPLFGRAFATSRLLIPADGFFEWTKEGTRRQGRYFQQPGGSPFAFAGVALHPQAASTAAEPGSVILTMPASESVRAYHHRMPVVVRPESFEEWLDERTTVGSALSLIESGASTTWASHSVGPSVNNVRNDSAECIRFAAPTPGRQGLLF